MKYSKKIGTIAAAAVLATGAIATAIAIPLTLNKKVEEKKANPDLFEIVDGEIKGFKPEVTKEQIAEYTADGVLRLPAAKVITADAFNAALKDAPFGDTIQIDAATTTIGPRAFYGNSATSVTFTGGASASQLKTIGDSAFAFCSGLASFTFPAGMFAAGSSVAKGAFFGCSSLEEIDCTCYTGAAEFNSTGWARNAFAAMPKTGKMIFAGTESTSETVKNNYAKVWTRLAYGGVNPQWTEAWNDGSKTDWVTQIKCAPDEYLTFGNDGATWTGINSAYWPTGTTYFNAINLPSTVTAVNLASGWNWSDRSAVTTWGLQNTRITAVPADFMKNATLGASVKVLLPNTVTTINADAFNGCTATVVFATDTALSTLGNNAFKSNTTLTSLKFGSGTVSIGTNAFEGCTGLTSIDFSALTSTTNLTIGADAFKSTGSSETPVNYTVTIKDVSSTSSIDQLQLENSFKTILNASGMTIGKVNNNTWHFSPATSATIAGLLDIQAGVLKGWAKNSSGVELSKDEINTIFTDKGLGTTLTIPTSVTSINEGAFNGEDGTTKIPSCITKVDFASTAACTSIGANAFNGATSLTEVVIPTSVTSIDNGAFGSCSSLATIDLSAWTSVPTWTGTDIFTGAASVGQVKVQKVENQIDQWRFNNQIKNLIGLTFGSSAWTFNNADSATLLNVDKMNVLGFSEGTGAYAESAALTDAEKIALATDKHGSAKIVVPRNVQNIKDGAFYVNGASTIPSGLNTVEFENKCAVSLIEEKAFFEAPITTLDFTNATNLNEINRHAFSGSAITKVSIPSNVQTIGPGAFYGCPNLTEVELKIFTNDLTFGVGAFANNSLLSTLRLTGCTALPNWGFAGGSGEDYVVFAGCAAGGTVYCGSAITDTILGYLNGADLANGDMANWSVSGS